MDVSQAELIGDKIISLFPLVRRSLLHFTDDHPHISNLWHRVLGMLNYCGALPTSEIAKKLCISKPHMTSLMNSMINERLVKRQPDKNDRRIINITITKKGCAYLQNSKKILKESIKKNLSELSDSDVKLLADSLENIRKTLSKLDEKQK